MKTRDYKTKKNYRRQHSVANQIERANGMLGSIVADNLMKKFEDVLEQIKAAGGTFEVFDLNTSNKQEDERTIKNRKNMVS